MGFRVFAMVGVRGLIRRGGCIQYTGGGGDIDIDIEGLEFFPPTVLARALSPCRDG